MNNTRRKAIAEVAAKFEAIRGALEEIVADIGVLKGEEETYKDNIPENMQDGDLYQAADSAVDKLGEAEDYIQDLLDNFADCLEMASE